MAELPFPSFETLAKMSGWIVQQAGTWFAIIKSPLVFLTEIDTNSTAALGRSIGFLAFVIVIMQLLMVPFDASTSNVDVLDVTYQLSSFVFVVLDVVIFSYAVFFFGRMLRGRGDAVGVFTCMFYAVAFYPIVMLSNYVNTLNPDVLTTIRTQNYSLVFSDKNPFRQHPFSGFVIFIVFVFATVWLISKLVPVVKFVHKFSTPRALTVIALAGFTEQAYVNYIWIPLLGGLAKKAT